MMAALADLAGEHILDCAARTDIHHPFREEANGIAWSMDDVVYMVFEDSNDGYRSAAASILSAKGPAYDFWDPTYLGRKVVGKHVTKSNDYTACDILELVDVETGHTWLRVGTDNTDDYYPFFVAEWKPMEAT